MTPLSEILSGEHTFLLFPLKCSHQSVKAGPSLYSFKLLGQGNSTNKLFLNRYMRQNDWMIRQSRFHCSILAKAALTHFTVFQFEVFPTVISGPASLNFKRPKQKQKTQHVPEQGRKNNHSVFFPTFYSTHFLPCVPCLSFFSLEFVSLPSVGHMGSCLVSLAPDVASA